MASSAMPSQRLSRGPKCYITRAFSRVPNTTCREKITIGYLTLVFSGAQKRAQLLCNPYILGGHQQQAQGENQKWLRHACLLGGPEEGANATKHLHSRGFPVKIPQSQTKGEKIRSGYLTRAFSGAQKRAQMLRNTYILGGPQHKVRRENPKWLPSWRPRRGRKCYATPAFSAVPNHYP